MIGPVTHGPHTYHTTNPVQFIYASENTTLPLGLNGVLQDIAPTRK
jgi:2,3-bisphosphoglycerate-independent phosphoglycerate mutase